MTAKQITMPPTMDLPTRRNLCRFSGYSRFVLAAVVGCFSFSRAAWAADVPDFVRDVRPILAEHCFPCHGPDGGKRQAGLRLDRPEGAVARLESGKVAIQPGSSKDSELVRRVESADADFRHAAAGNEKAIKQRTEGTVAAMD